MRHGRAWTMVAAALATMAAAPSPEPLSGNAPFPGVGGVTLVDYDVMGRDPAAIRRAMDVARPVDPNDGKRVDALSRYAMRWRWQSDGHGHCTIGDQDVSYAATVTVPRLVDPQVPAAVRARFDRYLASLMAHEEGHIRYAWDHRATVTAAMRAAGCDGAGAAARVAMDTIHAHEIAYDQQTRHGQTTILPFS